MKKWEEAEISCLDISNTEHEFKYKPSWDGGYLGDGEISGWFGKKKKNNDGNSTDNNNTTNIVSEDSFS